MAVHVHDDLLHLAGLEQAVAQRLDRANLEGDCRSTQCGRVGEIYKRYQREGELAVLPGACKTCSPSSCTCP